jgi:hypothetical protein
MKYKLNRMAIRPTSISMCKGRWTHKVQQKNEQKMGLVKFN